MKFNTYAATDQGPRDYQEDRFFESDTLIAVVDGMGGHPCGDLAAQLAVEQLDGVAVTNEADMRAVIQQMSAAVLGMDKLEYRHRTPGAVVAAAAICGDELIFGWCGDSRIYLNGRQLSTDHANEYGGITSCLGARVENPFIETSTYDAKLGDRVVVATDGMNVLAQPRFADKPETLLDAARAYGLRDNATFVAGLVDND